MPFAPITTSIFTGWDHGQRRVAIHAGPAITHATGVTMVGSLPARAGDLRTSDACAGDQHGVGPVAVNPSV